MWIRICHQTLVNLFYLKITLNDVQGDLVVATERTHSGYLWGEENVDYANKDHYHSAINENRISDEEYWAQSVFHGPSHAGNLTKEIFQKRVRNNCKVYGNYQNIVVTDSEEVRQAVRAEEVANGIKSTNLANSHSEMNYIPPAPDKITSFFMMMKIVVPKLQLDEVKVLAFYLVREGLDPAIEMFMDDESIKPLADCLREVWAFEDYKVSTLNDYIGTRYRADSARWFIMTKFNEVLNLEREIDQGCE